MTRKEGLDWLYRLRSEIYVYMPKEWLIPMNNALDMGIKALRDIKEIVEIINCDADAETKCKMISNILTAKPHYFEKQGLNYTDQDTLMSAT